MYKQFLSASISVNFRSPSSMIENYFNYHYSLLGRTNKNISYNGSSFCDLLFGLTLKTEPRCLQWYQRGIHIAFQSLQNETISLASRKLNSTAKNLQKKKIRFYLVTCNKCLSIQSFEFIEFASVNYSCNNLWNNGYKTKLLQIK